MALPSKESPTLQRSPNTIRGTVSQTTPQQDPLIAKDLQKGQYIGIFAVAIALILAVGFFSRKVEYALLFATTLSIILIVSFLTL